MQESHTLLNKLVETLSQSSDPFKMQNARLSALPREIKEIRNPEPRCELTQGIWLDFQEGAGVETVVGPAEARDGVRLLLKERGDSAYYSFSYDIPPEPLREARYLGQLLRCSSAGPARFQVCLRYILADGFRDVFARDVVVLTGEAQEDLVFLRIDADLAQQAVGAEVLFFFDGRSFDVTLQAIEALLV